MAKLTAEDAGRVKVNGPQPVSADDALSGEKEVRIDGLHGVSIETGRGDLGQPTLKVMPLSPPGVVGLPRVPGVPTVSESIHAEAEKREALIAAARESIVPACETWAQARTCSLFVGKNGRGEPTGSLTWCRGKDCPAMKAEACCGMNALGVRELLVARVQPASREELDKLLLLPGNRLGSDTEARVAVKVGEILAELAASKRADAKLAAERDQSILEARREERQRPRIEFATPDTIDARRKAIHDAARIGR